MAQKTETLRYQLPEFLKYKDLNKTMPQDIVPYCYNNRSFQEPNLSPYTDTVKSIVLAITNGDNTNDTVFKNNVKFYINTINKKNYNDFLSKLSNLDYSTRENVHFLAHELIVCAMRCPIAIKGNKSQYSEQEADKGRSTISKPLSEICSDMIKHFSTTLTKESNNNISFQEELLKLCRQFFMDFVNISKSMDEHNENTADNYKGFMTLLGNIFMNGLLPTKHIIDCIDSIKRTIFNSRIQLKTEQMTPQLIKQHEKMFGSEKPLDKDSSEQLSNNELYYSIVYFDTNIPALSNDPNRYMCYRNLIECTNYYKGYNNLINSVVFYLHGKIKDLIRSDTTTETAIITIKKLKEYVTILVESHQEFMKLNQQYKVKAKTNANTSANANSNISHPLKPHIVILHNENGEKINNLVSEMEHLNIKIQKYKAVQISQK
jgi:hypothetical protein